MNEMPVAVLPALLVEGITLVLVGCGTTSLPDDAEVPLFETSQM